MMLLSIILISAWWLFKRCSDDWKTVVIGSLIGASGFPLAAIGLIYFAAAQFAFHIHLIPSFDPTWLNISTASDGCKHPWFLAPCLPHPVQSLHCMHHCQEGSHCVLDLLGSWMGSLVPWASPVDCHERIRICSNSAPMLHLTIPFLPLHIKHSSQSPLPTSYLHSHLDGMFSVAQSITASPSSFPSSPLLLLLAIGLCIELD